MCGLRTAYLDGEQFVLTVEGRVLAVRECASKLAEIVVGTNFRRCFFRCFVLLFFFFWLVLCWLLSCLLEVDRVVVVVVEVVGVRDVRHR